MQDFHITGGELKLDEKIDCRVCVSSLILLGSFKKKANQYARSSSDTIFPINLDYSVVYLPILSLYVALWKLVGEDVPEHRSILMSWQGGVPVQLQSDKHLQEALRFGVKRVLSGEYRDGLYNTEVFIPHRSLVERFKEEGWVESIPEVPEAQ